MAKTTIARAKSLTLLQPYSTEVPQQVDLVERPRSSSKNLSPEASSFPLFQPLPLTPVLPEHHFISTIAALSSQHHLSEYNRLKHGDQGSPFPYIPLSVQLPQHFKELRNKQQVDLSKETFFPAKRAVRDSVESCLVGSSPSRGSLEICLPIQTSGNEPVSQPTLNLAGTFSRTEALPQHDCTLAVPSQTISIEEAISHAMSSTLTMPSQHIPFPPTYPQAHLYQHSKYQPKQHSTLAPELRFKTSESHPINISSIIPPDLIDPVTAHLGRKYPLVFLHSSRTPIQYLPSILEVPSELRFTHFFSEERGRQLQVHPIINVSHSAEGHIRTSQPLFPSLGSQPRPSKTSPKSKITARRVNGLASSSTLETSSGLSSTVCDAVTLGAVDVKSHIPGTPDVALSSMALSTEANHSLLPSTCMGPAPVRSHSTETSASGSHDEAPISSLPFPFNKDIGPFNRSGGPRANSSPGRLHIRPPSSVPPGFRIGNLFLSSCPGKKVRLSGPVKGRGTICRSLRLDLSRIRSLGVGLIINCLDDTELQFLGAPWSEYADVAANLGLDILRIPTPEGLAPLDVEQMDAQLDWVIRTYTLKGVSVLVHCRGGVGRAGLVAASWIIKMGLCGPADDTNYEHLPHQVGLGVSQECVAGEGVVHPETLALVEQAVFALRRQRSIKAIETYEQARFLIDFTDYLRTKTKYCSFSFNTDTTVHVTHHDIQYDDCSIFDASKL